MVALGKWQSKDAEGPISGLAKTTHFVVSERTVGVFCTTRRDNFTSGFGEPAVPHGCPAVPVVSSSLLACMSSWVGFDRNAQLIYRKHPWERGRAPIFFCSWGRAGRGSCTWRQVSLCVRISRLCTGAGASFWGWHHSALEVMPAPGSGRLCL